MTVQELSREQLNELKERYLIENRWNKKDSVSWYDLMNIDNLVSDKKIFKEYEGVCFVDDDFFCSAGY